MIPSAINLLINTAHMASYTFMPNLAKDLGAGDFGVGLIVSAYGAMSFVAYYLFGRASDMHGRRRILKMGLLLSAIAFLLQVTAKTEKELLLARAFAGFCYGIAPAALIAYVYEAKKSIGKYSSYGSLGWLFGALAAGVLASYSKIFILSSALFFIAFLLSLRMPNAREKKVSIPLFPTELIKKNKVVYTSYLLRHLGAYVTWTIFPLYLISIGASYFWVGVMHAINSGTQFLVMRRLDGVNERKLILWGLVLSFVVFSGYALASDFRQLIPLQIVLGFSWSFLYIGSLESLLSKNMERATAAGLLNSTISLAGIIGPIIAGAITVFSGYRAAVAFSAFLCLTALWYDRQYGNLI